MHKTRLTEYGSSLLERCLNISLRTKNKITSKSLRISCVIMNATDLKNLQAPLKEKYQQQPESAVITLRAQGKVGEGISCKVETGKAMVEAGLHPATGGTGMLACSGDMLLEALVACAGVTLQAVSTAIGVDIKGGTITAEGDLDFKGT